MRLVALAFAFMAGAIPAAASEASAEQEIRSLIDTWYGELKKGREGRPYSLLAPHAVLGPRSCECGEEANQGPLPKNAQWTPLSKLLDRAALFQHTIETVRLDNIFARVQVWERGWICAWAVNQTYENAASTTFVLEKRDDGRWKVLVYSAQPRAVRPDHKNEPMPDLCPKDGKQ